MRGSACLRSALLRAELPRRAAPRAQCRRMAAAAPSEAGAGAGAASLVPPSTRDDGFRVVSETVSYKRYLTIYDRTVQFPADGAGKPGASYAYDVVGHPRAAFHFCCIFPFHSGPEPAVTMIREYAQGPNHFVWSFPAGGVDSARHASLEATAAAELSEECGLLPGTLVRLLPAEHPGILETKWCRNRFTPFLAIDPAADPSPGARDPEESCMTVHRVPLSRLEELLYGDDVLLPSLATAQLALRELRKRGLLPPDRA